MRRRRGKRRSSVDGNVPKEKVKRQSKRKPREIADSSAVSTNDISEPVLDTSIISDDTTEQPTLHVKPAHPPPVQHTQLNYNNIYLILFLALAAIVVGYFLVFK